ncbi:hypothetical protein BDK51DRAFT_26714, partial [Blyttiomyces helicus]
MPPASPPSAPTDSTPAATPTPPTAAATTTTPAADGPLRIQLIPHSDVPGRPPLGEIIERRFDEGLIVRIGRQVLRDGQPAPKPGAKVKPIADSDVWYTSKVVSRNHAEMWAKGGQ